MDHAVSLFSESPYNSKDGYLGFLISFLITVLFKIRLLYFDWLYNIINRENCSSSADSRAAMKYNFTFLCWCALYVWVYFCCKRGVHYFIMPLVLLMRVVIVLNVFNKLFNDLIICLFRSSMIRPWQIIQLNYFSHFNIFCLIYNFKFSSNQILHQSLWWYENNLYKNSILFKFQAFTNFRGPILITFDFTMLFCFC